MTTPQTHPDEQAFIPPHYLLILALAGLLIALIVAITQPGFGVVGWGGLGLAVLSLIAWVVMAPEQAKAVVTGRTMRFGGTSVLVTVIVVVAMVAIYTLIRQQNWRVDLTQRDTFSLTTESRQAIAAMGADPTVPKVKITAFYGPSQAGRRDRDQLLFEDYSQTSAGKISYEFVDPDKNPALATQLGVNNAGQLYVTRLNDDGTLDTKNGKLLTFLSQDGLTNAILQVAAGGDFRAYFIQVNNGLSMIGADSNGMSKLRTTLENQLDWTTRQASLFEFAAPDSPTKLLDPNADGEVMIIPGGDTPLSADELKIVTDYLDKGGKVVIFAGPSSNADTTSLSTGQGLSDYLWKNFGVRFQDNIILDQTQALQSPAVPVAIKFSTSHYITNNFPSRAGMVFELPHSIEVADTAPANVTVTTLATSSDKAYAKTDFQQVINGTLDPTPDDPTGPFVLAAAAENSQTGAKLVLFGSTSIPSNGYALINNVVNLEAAFNSLVWATGFDQFFTKVNIQSAQRPQDTPIFLDQQTARTINLITMLLIPFGILGLGVLVWWNNRESAH